MEDLVLHSNGEQLLILIQNLEALLSILPPSVLNLCQFPVETVNGGFLGLPAELLGQSHQFLCFLDEVLIELHSVIQLLPDNLVFEHHVFAISNRYQFEEELLQVGRTLLLENLSELVHPLELCHRQLVQKVGIVDLVENLAHLVGDGLHGGYILLVEASIVLLLYKLYDGQNRLVVTHDGLTHVGAWSVLRMHGKRCIYLRVVNER